MSMQAGRLATYEDLCRVPPHLIAQIIRGQLITLPRPAPRHALAASSLGEELTGPFQKGRGGGPGGWWILDEPELHLGADILVPDLADWVCEVLSPLTAQMDRVDKLPIYASHGVNHAWLLDPEAKTLEILSLHEGHWQLEIALKEADEVCAVPFEAVRFGLAALWP